MLQWQLDEPLGVVSTLPLTLPPLCPIISSLVQETPPMTTDTEIKKVVDDLLISIAQKHFPSVETLEVRNSDSLDFHEVYVESIRDALKDAFIAGMSRVA